MLQNCKDSEHNQFPHLARFDSYIGQIIGGRLTDELTRQLLAISIIRRPEVLRWIKKWKDSKLEIFGRVAITLPA